MSLERPNWNNKEDRELYYSFPSEEKLGRKYTEEEKHFFRSMYHFEEEANGIG